MTLILVQPTPQTSAAELAKTLRKCTGAAKGVGQANGDGGFVVLETKDSYCTIQKIAGTFGVEKVSTVIECESRFSAVSKAIAEVGRRTVGRRQSFFVKAHLFGRHDFAARDLEFAATGALAAELVGTASPAKNEQKATIIISAYICRTRAFVTLREYEGAGGTLAGSLGRASCAITGQLSLASCIAASRTGFSLPELLLLYSEEDGDLYRNAKLARSLAEKTGAKRQKIMIAKVAAIAHPKDDRAKAIRLLQMDLAAARMMIMMMPAKTESKNIILPLSLAVHPQWFIETAMKEVHDAGKVPFAPLMFSEIDSKEKEGNDARGISHSEFTKLKKVTLGKPKRIRLEVGPDYLHDIIDSV